MIWVGYVYLLILVLFGGSALLDDIKAKKIGRFAISLVPFTVLLLATVGFLFLPKPGPLAWAVLAALAVSVPILVWDSAEDVKHLSKTDPEFGTGGAIASAALTIAIFAPGFVMGVLWTR